MVFVLEKVGFFMNCQGEEANIALAEELCRNNDKEGIEEIVASLNHKDKRVANDCIKVLYEIGERKPELIANYWEVFVTLLSSKENRLVWGAMTALASMAQIKADLLYPYVNKIVRAMNQGSVITVDQSVTVLAKISGKNETYSRQIVPILMDHIRHCRPKELAQHAQRMEICINQRNAEEFFEIIDQRRGDVSDAAAKRLVRLKKRLSTSLNMN